MRTDLLLTTALATFIGCKREGPPADPPSHLEPAARGTEGPRVMEPSRELTPIVQRLQWEADHRPGKGITSEQVFDALERGGIRLERKRQYLGATLNASYCAGGVTADGVAISVCEYPSAAAAEDGKGFVQQRFAAMTPHARRLVRGPTLLTVAAPSGDNDVVTRAVEMFSSL